MQTIRTTVPRIATTATVLVGLTLTLPGGRAQADPEPPGPGFNGGCVAKNVTGKYTQTASFPGIGRLTWNIDTEDYAADDCDNQAGAVSDQTGGQAKGPARNTHLEIKNVQWTADRVTWHEIPLDLCAHGGCGYRAKPQIPHPMTVKAIRHTTYLIHNSDRSSGLTFTCDFTTSKCHTG
ncbi:MAG TPA: hypothetical protein VHV82_00300 [Sporichthyaceae bacterium]|nr:hypothetical protein [Sporichthyaceae bacterium]